MNGLKPFSDHWNLGSINLFRYMVTSAGDKFQSSTDPTLPEEPTTCCMSGCANCVWIEYANKLNSLFQDSPEKTRDVVLSKVTDPNMKAFLIMELKALEKKKLDQSS